MEIGFNEETFTKSLIKMARSNTWWYKTYELFRYDFPRFFKNVWRFRKPLWRHVWFDHHGALEFLEISLIHISDKIEKVGNEIDETRLKKVAAMRRAITLIRNYNNDLYVEEAEKELGKMIMHPWEFEDIPDKPGYSRLKDSDTPEEREHNKRIFERAREIEKNEWNELFLILKGQDYITFSETEDWNKQFDGTGIKGWWD